EAFEFKIFKVQIQYARDTTEWCIDANAFSDVDRDQFKPISILLGPARSRGSTPKSRTVVKGLRTSGLAWRPFVASSDCGTARCIRTHRPVRHRASGRSCGRPARA